MTDWELLGIFIALGAAGWLFFYSAACAAEYTNDTRWRRALQERERVILDREAGQEAAEAALLVRQFELGRTAHDVKTQIDMWGMENDTTASLDLRWDELEVPD